MDDLLQKFSLEKLNPAPAAINFTKLDYFNGLHIRSLETGDLAQRVRPFMEQAGFVVDEVTLLKAVPLIRERLVTLDEAPQWIGFFFREEVLPAPEDLIGSKMSASESAAAARRALAVLEGLPELTLESAEPPMRLLADELGLQAGQLFGILRVAVTGQKVSPPLFESMEIIGRGKVLERLKRAAEVLENRG
jgi:glutamyl-tRNA synthetase